MASPLLLLFRGGLFLTVANGFGLVTKPMRPTTKLHVSPFPELATSAADVSAARGAFGLCFFGAAGTAALGRSALPIVWEKFQLTQSLKGKGPTLGGETVGLPAVTLYPEDIACADVQDIIQHSTNMTAAEIVARYPIPDKLPGYLTYEAFALANPGNNPLAVRAVFESLAPTSDIVTPATAQAALETYRDNLGLMKDNLAKSKALSYTAVVVLIVLLGLADYFAVYHFYRGWFPDWPGAQNFPLGFIDKDFGLLAIPNYWI